MGGLTAETKHCPLCGAKYPRLITSDENFVINGKRIEIKGCSKIWCPYCGESFFIQETSDRIFKILNEIRQGEQK